MKKLIFLAAIIIVFSLNVNAQNRNQISIGFSNNQLELSFQKKFVRNKLWSEAFVGLGNQDINRQFDDLLAGVRIGIPVFKSDQNEINVGVSAGAYFANNSYNSIVVPVGGGMAGFNHFFGIEKNHCLRIHVGYQYGERSFKQEYQDATIHITTIDRLVLSPLYLSIGYGFLF